MSTPTTHKVKGRLVLVTRDVKRLTPTMECLDGVIRGATLGPLCKSVNLPLLLIESTKDTLDSTATTEVRRLLCTSIDR